MDQQGTGQKDGATKQGAPRRLGRGLSSLIGPAPVRVDVPPEQEAPGSVAGHDVTSRHNITISNSGVPTAARPAEPGPEPMFADRIVMVPVGDGEGAGGGGASGGVAPSPFQPREVFDEAKIRELAESIRSIGMMQPIIVRRVGAGYELVAGERRWRAARLAGLTHVPALVRDISDDESAAWGLIENVQREDLDPIEKGEACRVMMERFGMSPQDLAARLGLDRSTIVNMVRMTELDETIQTLMRRGDLTMGHARSLLAVPPENGVRLALGTLASMEGWSVRKLEQEVKKVSKGKPVPQAKSGIGGGNGGGGAGATRTASLVELERQLGEHMGTRVKIKTDKSGKRGRIELAFFDLDHFDGLLQRMGYGGKT